MSNCGALLNNSVKGAALGSSGSKFRLCKFELQLYLTSRNYCDFKTV